MRLSCKLLTIAWFVFALPVVAKADFSQLPGGIFAPTTISGGTTYQSVFDTGPINAGELRNFSVAYDNFSSATGGSLDSITWVGKYLDPLPNPTTQTFHIELFADNGSNRPANNLYVPTPLFSTVLTATETLDVLSGGDQYYRYTATIPSPVFLAPGTQYWLSILGEQPYGQNAFGWAFSNIGDGLAVGDFQPSANAAIQRFAVGGDFAFSASITAVPEPSSCLLLAGAAGTICWRKWRGRRKVTV